MSTATATATASDLTGAPGRRRRMSARTAAILALFAVVVLALALTLGLSWWTHGRFVQTTNDAYLQADQVAIAPKVQGYVGQVFVRDNQAVAVGQPLVRIDAANYDAALAQQAAAVTARQADIEAAHREVAEASAAVTRAEAELAGVRDTARYAAGEAARFRDLAAKGVETAERAAQAQNQSDQAATTVKADEAAVAEASGQLATRQAGIGQADAQLGAAEAQVKNARINLGDTLLRASIAGRVGDKTVRVGQFVQPGTRMMSLVPVQDVYIVANFKETQIGRIRIGQVASVRIDALRDTPIRAVVESFAPGTGAQFALLPPENATGNFTKIVQRVPVRLHLDTPADLRDHLIPGLSAVVRIDTTQPRAARR